MADDSSIWDKLTRSVVNTPDDDGPRVEFAAVLDDHAEEGGQPFRDRATFIRTQVKLANIHAGHPEWLAMSARSKLLLHRYDRGWLPEEFRRSWITEPRYFRGFVAHLTLHAFARIEMSATDFDAAPIEHLDFINLDSQLYTLRSVLEWLGAIGILRRLRSLAFDAQELTDDDAKYLTQFELPRLRWLSLTDNNIGESGVSALIEHFQDLPFVDLTDNPGDPHDTFEFDQGFVIARYPGWATESWPRVSWLKPRVLGGRLLYPSRYRMIQPRIAG